MRVLQAARRAVIVSMVLALAVLAVIPVVVAAGLRRFAPRRRQPVILFGLTPIINIKYWSRALRSCGYESYSLVYEVYVINERSDFDFTPETLFPRLARLPGFRGFEGYACFFWTLWRFDVLVLDFHGGCLRSTPLRFLELPLRRFAGQEIVAIPYGADAIDLDRCHHSPSRAALMLDYPLTAAAGRSVRRWVHHYARWSSFIVCGGMMIDFLPRFDLLVTTPLCIDTSEWRPAEGQRDDDGVVRILHAPNHRQIKGTPLLVRACEELRSEGVPVELIVVERAPNTEVRRVMQQVDIVASAFVMGFYELFALEGMSMGKPVLNYWRPDLKLIYTLYSYAAQCPIVDARPFELKERIRELVQDSELREALGREGRRYVEQYHSVPAVGSLLDKIVRHVWTREPVDFSDVGLSLGGTPAMRSHAESRA